MRQAQGPPFRFELKFKFPFSSRVGIRNVEKSFVSPQSLLDRLGGLCHPVEILPAYFNVNGRPASSGCNVAKIQLLDTGKRADSFPP